MKQQRLLFSKYYCDNKLGIYSTPPMNNKQYKKMISNAKSKYMDEYNSSTNKTSRYCEEKKFNNLLSNYYEDFNKLKSKYKFTEEETEKTEPDVSEEDFMIKRQSIDKIFSGDLFDLQDLNFDVTDNIINELPKENNFSLIKNTQIKEDYDFRLQGFLKNKKYMLPNDDKITDEEMENFNENEENNENEKNINLKAKNELNNKIENDIINENNENNENNLTENDNKENDIKTIEEKEQIGYIENDTQFNLENNENYLKLNQPSLNDDLPLFMDIISCNNNIIYQVPFYEYPGYPLETTKKTEEEDRNKIMKSQEEEKNKLIKSQEEEKYSDFENENNKKDEIIDNNKEKIEEKDNVNYEYNENNNINNNIDENNLVLENTNQENMKLEDIINSDFKGDYKIPEYKIPDNIKKELEQEQKEENKENKQSINKEDIMVNPNINDLAENNNNLQMINDIVKNNEVEQENKKEELNDMRNNNNKIEKNEMPKNDDEDDKFEKIELDELDDDDKKYDDFDG